MPSLRARVGTAAGAGRAVWRTFGTKGLTRRALYEAAKRSGRVRRIERRERAAGPLHSAWRLIAPSTVVDREGAVAAAEAVLAGTLRLFGGRSREVGWPPRWHHDPDAAVDWPAGVHWSTLDDSGAAGDVKNVWEISRFGFVGPLCRAWAASGDDRYAEAFWSAVEDWDRQNPPYLGPNWMCAQETSLRALAILFGAAAFRSSAATTPSREELLGRMVARSIQRVRATLPYARSQRNNHAISEGVFLTVVSAAFPSHPDAAAIGATGRATLSEALDDQFYADGTYAQFSPTYHRLALHLLLFLDWTSRHLGATAPKALERVLVNSHHHLAARMEPSTGLVPNSGGNDGALLLHLTSQEITDFRPIVSTLAARISSGVAHGHGPWEEELSWLGLAAPAAGPVRPARPVIAAGPDRAVLRTGTRRHRPAHADMLHLDLWVAGVAVVCDPGSFRYSDLPPWDNGLADEEVHNGPRVPGHPQARRRGRFFWTAWSDAHLVEHRRESGIEYLVGAMDLDGVQVSRLVAWCAPGWMVIDRSPGAPIMVSWNLPPDASLANGEIATRHLRATFSAAAVVSSERSIDDPASGWWSWTYGELLPRTVVNLSDPTGLIVSRFAGPDDDLPSAQIERRLRALIE